MTSDLIGLIIHGKEHIIRSNNPLPFVSWIPDAELCSDPGAIGFELNSNAFRATNQDGERSEITTSNTTEITASAERESTLPGTMLGASGTRYHSILTTIL